jgi:hypothetical protein
MYKFKQLIAKSTSTTRVLDVAAPQVGLQPIIRQLTNLPSHASDNFDVFLARPEYVTKATRNTTPTQTATHIFIDVDVAAGHVVGGHTLTTSDYLIIATPSGYLVRVISAIADVSAKTYCDVTIPTITTAAVAGAQVFVVRAADITNFVSGGTTRVQLDYPYAGYTGCPLAIGATSNGSNNQTVAATVMYVTAAEPFPA